MLTPLCELRFDIALPPGTDFQRFERAWHAELAAQKMTALAMPPAKAVTARYRVCRPLSGVAELDRYLAARLAALPGNPTVAQETPASGTDWVGVKIWLSYRSSDLVSLLLQGKPKTKKHPKKPYQLRGHRV